MDISINKIEIEDETVLELATKDDFQFYFRINEQIEVVTNQGNSFNGKISYIGEDYLKIKMINNIETKIMYSSIIDVDKKKGIEII